MVFTRYPSSFFTSNVYVYKASPRDAFLFDIGEIDSVISGLKGDSVKALFLTHCHYDHIYFINELVEQFPSIRIFGHKSTLEALGDPKENLSFYHESPVSYTGKNLCALQETQSQGMLEFGSTRVSWFCTPGHHPGALSYKVGRYLITGDSYIPGYPVVTKLKGGDKALASESMDFLIRIAEKENLIIAPGHGKEMHIDEARCFDELQENPTIPVKKK